MNNLTINLFELLTYSFYLQSLLITLVRKMLLPFKKISRLLVHYSQSLWLFINFFFLEAKIIFELIYGLLLSLSVILSLMNVLINELKLSSKIIISFSNCFNISVCLKYFWFSVFYLSLSRLNLIINLNSLLFSILNGFLEAFNFSFMMLYDFSLRRQVLFIVFFRIWERNLQILHSSWQVTDEILQMLEVSFSLWMSFNLLVVRANYSVSSIIRPSWCRPALIVIPKALLLDWLGPRYVYLRWWEAQGLAILAWNSFSWLKLRNSLASIETRLT